MKKRISKITVILTAAVLALSFLLTACGSSAPAGGQGSGAAPAATVSSGNQEAAPTAGVGLAEAPELPGLKLESTMEKKFATEFDVFYYTDGYKVISVSDGRQYLLIPEGKEIPEGAPESLIPLYQPLNKCYLAATSAMSLIIAIDALDNIKMSGTNASGWYIPEAAAALENGSIMYAGKYSEPDYEMLIDQECSVAIESTMILHTPKVQEMIEKMDIPVFIDRSSYEDHALGRCEWVKLYGAMFDKEELAEAKFEEKAAVLDEMEKFTNTEKTVAYFLVKTDGTVLVRNPEDYIAAMIEMGGARYAFRDMQVPINSGSTISISMEEFYATAVDADYLIYNATMSAPIKTLDDLLAHSELFADFKAVKEGNVWCGGNTMYQNTMDDVEFIRDINNMVTTGDEASMTFLTKVDTAQ